MKFILTREEVWLATVVGKLQHRKALERGRCNTTEKGISHDDGEKYHVRGCKGEIAWARYLNVYWPFRIGAIDTGRGDLKLRSGLWAQVKTTDAGFETAILHAPDSLIFLFAFISEPNAIELRGWLHGDLIRTVGEFHAADEKYHLSCYTVHQDYFRDIGLLP